MKPAEFALFDPSVLLGAHVTVHPAARLLCSAFPVAALWTLQRQADTDLSTLTWQPEAVLITRPDAEVRLARLHDDAAGFAGNPPQEKASKARPGKRFRSMPDFDVGTTLAGLADDGFITEIRT